jgi:hypothetical protein
MLFSEQWIKKESIMEFISSAVLGGLLWDSLKAGAVMTSVYLKEQLQDYLFDEATLLKLNDLTRQLPEKSKISQAVLQIHLEQDQEWQAIKQHIVKNTAQTTTFTQNISGDHAKGFQINNVDTLNIG